MSTILPHGIIQIDEGNTSWYNNITDNWQLIDSKIGEYDAAITTIPTAANDGVLTIKVNGATAGTFTANQATNEEINITAGGDVTYATDADMAEMAETWSV